MVEVRLERSAGGALGLDVLYRPELSIYPVVASTIGAAEVAGLREGDEVLSVDGTPLVAGSRLGALLPAAQGEFILMVRRVGPPPAAAPPPRKPPPPPRR